MKTDALITPDTSVMKRRMNKKRTRYARTDSKAYSRDTVSFVAVIQFQNH
jgi:hypothetical protein